ncbi:glycine/D-amino acid oxidase-like deaminating enzyme/nitrite reductase/ring-hydroxylating ferredoxin subunit [Paenibacillus shirakamiensis]|uniref:Glycine/D-amino acid oxidase-like deaminating enzyme/nitrite reductase/ring-hydroxylating ferredoxin subunit n=1 Tax=Paenibacillus shirakamiensis TaxID=1265935 RepID=A0ABS4JMQ4_9BACL|nr:FAD-dependent oxidoreductase [Paenibacillus shirakamiensis]MBP2001884.1 glycine/D-amino acid oxidase-like deaminating enzyme/nitrite reductase/ring-hydroxylating ferredoxin subunit [Paenibacillus shirakamiensis]
MSTSHSPYSDLPQFPESMWRDTAKLPTFPALDQDIQTEVAVIGAGITGITTAYLLAREGFKVVLADMNQVLEGTTGYTTAKVTTQHGLVYDKLIKHFSEKEARLYYESNQEGLALIRELVGKHNMDCQFKEQDAYLYADNEKDLKELRKEWKAYEKLKLPGQWVESIPLPIPVLGAIVVKNQAQFHPLEYLKALLEDFIAHGGTVYEHTTLEDQADDHNGKLALKTLEGHTITCDYAVSGSHFPFFDGGELFFTKLHAERSYVVAGIPETSYSGGMYLSSGSNVRSIRSAEWDGQTVILYGGEGHKTGQGICTIKHYENLEQFGGELLGLKSIPYRWSAQDLFTLDGVPYIGPLSDKHPNVFVATGFGKWGMTNGTLAALMIRDQIQNKENRYTNVYTPSRFKLNPNSLKTLVVQGADTAQELISGKIDILHRKAEELKPDEGALVRYDGKKAAAYRNSDGELYIVDATCTHMGCEVEWNEGERSWDCPCHGSRFNVQGAVLEGPAIEPLPNVKKFS